MSTLISLFSVCYTLSISLFLLLVEGIHGGRKKETIWLLRVVSRRLSRLVCFITFGRFSRFGTPRCVEDSLKTLIGGEIEAEDHELTLCSVARIAYLSSDVIISVQPSQATDSKYSSHLSRYASKKLPSIVAKSEGGVPEVRLSSLKSRNTSN